jgi:2-polyprenyl-3-methyl-5-hydroxy-6-metoxy-1,4-benzoquinol methylase
MTGFDHAAERFTQSTDRAIATNNYLRGRLFLDMIRSRAVAGGSVLDYGCGPGRLAHLIARNGFSVRAVDTSNVMIERARELDCTDLKLQFDTIGLGAEALESHSYDAIVCSSVIEYVARPDELLRQFHRALHPSGVLAISYANRSSLWRRYWERNAEANPMFTPNNQTWDWRDFKSLLGEHDFRPTCAPIFFESPCDRYTVFKRFSFAGTVGIVAARPISSV